MKRVLFKIIVPAVLLVLWMVVCYPVCDKAEEFDYFLYWIMVGCPYGIRRMCMFLIPRNFGIAGSMGILALNCIVGYRINPVTGQEQLHRGVDIAVPTGTEVLAAMDGTVTSAAYDAEYGNYVVIEDSKGYCTKYAHMDTLSVSAGQSITHGTVIGTTGNTGSSTGSHLHIECLYNGEYYNPLFYFEAGEGTLYGETPGAGSGGGNAVPPDSYDDATVQALMAEAARYLGYPYVWGGSSPSTSFDCSGYVCYVFTNSGVHNLSRTTAQGIYDQCIPVSAADAKAGDIIFFTGTYNSGGAVSHVGIYCGNGVMIHCGDPIKYANINTAYWQSHFYSFGRLH